MSDPQHVGEALTLKYFVGGIPSDATHKQLFDFFRAYGVVKRITIFNNDARGGRKLYGFCFVKFKKLFIQYALDDKSRLFIFQGRKLEIDSVVRRSNLKQMVQEKHSKRIFLQNIPKALQKADLLKVFSKFGPIVNCFVIEREKTRKYLDSDEPGRGQSWKNNYGYVIFQNKEDADGVLRKRYIELGDKTRIYIKKYSSSINRNNSEGDNPPPLDISSRNTLKRKPSNSETLSAGKDEEDKTPVTHFVKPTRRGYFEASDQRLHNRADNLRFNICSPPL